MTSYDTTGRRLPLPRARFEPPEPWRDTDQKQLLQVSQAPSGSKFLLTLHALVTSRAVAVGNTRKGAWRLSRNGTVCAALPDDWFTRSAGVVPLVSFCQ